MRGMNDLLRQAQMMQSKLTKIQEELATRSFEGSSGGGMVRVTCTGKHEVQNIVLDKSVVSPDDVDMLQDLILAAINDAVRRADAAKEQEMGSLTGGMKIPGLF